MKLENYLKLPDISIGEFAKIIGSNRETIRKYRDDPRYTGLVYFDSVTMELERVQVDVDQTVFCWDKKSS